MSGHDSEYDRLINNKWNAAGLICAKPEQHRPTDENAIKGARQIYRKAMGKPWKGPVKITSGNRYTWIRRGTLMVNPWESDRWGRSGWPEIVHSLSHYAHSRLRPRERPHSINQLELEKELTNYVLSDTFKKYRRE